MEKLFQRLPELSPFVRVLHGDGRVGAPLVRAGPDYIFVTGSTPTGRKVMQAAADNLTPVACELGGKDAVIVLADADVREAAFWSTWGSNFNAGQTCMAVERAYVLDAVYDEFVRDAVEFTRRLKMGYTSELESPYYLGPVTDPRQIEIIERHMADALAKGAQVLTGGKRNGMFYEPTVLVNVDHTMDIMREETFGPILPIVRVKTEEEAIALANDNQFGLGASVWSKSLAHAQRVAHRLEAASVIVNDTIAQFALPLVPFGGIKASGSGRTHGREGLVQFTRPYSYVVGRPPLPYDLTVIARRPGHYWLLWALMCLICGTTPAQRLRPLRGRHTSPRAHTGRRDPNPAQVEMQ